jgi:hypothetical protein
VKTEKLLFYSLAAILVGCVPVMSLHPLYTEKDIIFEEKLLGTWVDDSNDTVWEFQRVVDESEKAIEFKRPDRPENAYKLLFHDNKDGTKGSFFAHLVKLENKLFLDVYPSQLPYVPKDPNEGWLYNIFFLVPVHTFIRVDSIDPQLGMMLTDDDGMKKLLAEDPNAVKYELTDDNLILTASTQELQAFVLKYADDSRVFSNEIVLSRKKVQDPNDPNAVDPNYIEPNDTDPNEVIKTW